MIPVKQTKLHSETTAGNCLAAVVSSILEIPIEKVPEFETMGTEWMDELIKFLDSQNHKLIFVYDEDDFKHFGLDIDKDLCYVAIGKSPRNTSIRHAVIFKDRKMVHDPHPSNDGILTEDVYWIIKEK